MKLRPLLNTVTTGLGLIMVLSPLTLWIAWFEKRFYGVLLTLGLSFCILSLIKNCEAVRVGR